MILLSFIITWQRNIIRLEKLEQLCPITCRYRHDYCLSCSSEKCKFASIKFSYSDVSKRDASALVFSDVSDYPHLSKIDEMWLDWKRLWCEGEPFNVSQGCYSVCVYMCVCIRFLWAAFNRFDGWLIRKLYWKCTYPVRVEINEELNYKSWPQLTRMDDFVFLP